MLRKFQLIIQFYVFYNLVLRLLNSSTNHGIVQTNFTCVTTGSPVYLLQLVTTNQNLTPH